MTYYIRMKDGRRWKVRQAVSLQAACDCIVQALVSGSVGGVDIVDRTYTTGGKTVMADVVQINSDNTERRPYQEAY